MAERGVKELILISQDTTMYGLDRNDRGALSRLLHALNDIDGLEWIRLLYLYPTTIGADTIDAIADCDKVCKYIDLPLQHAADRVLKRMGRPGTRLSYERLLESIRHRIPEVVLRTTFIVGFPGETDSDLEETLSLCRKVEFDNAFIFNIHVLDVTAGAKRTGRIYIDPKGEKLKGGLIRARKIPYKEAHDLYG